MGSSDFHPPIEAAGMEGAITNTVAAKPRPRCILRCQRRGKGLQVDDSGCGDVCSCLSVQCEASSRQALAAALVPG